MRLLLLRICFLFADSGVEGKNAVAKIKCNLFKSKCMKKITILISSMFVVAVSNGQTFTTSPTDFIEATYDFNECVSDYIYLNNTSGVSLDLSYQTLVNTIDPIGWSNLLCTNLGCSAYVPSAGSLGTIAIGASGYFDLHVCFYGIVGSGEIKFRVYESGNPSNADTLTYRYHAISTADIASLNQEETQPLSQNYPNPVVGITTIKYNLGTPDGKLVVTDVLGKTLFEYNLSKTFGEFIFNEKLSSGIYFYSLYQADKMIDRKKMIIQ